jgi:hypothetical protein
MQMRLIRGKNIVSAGYDPVTGTLRTRFGKSGEYDYSGVPEDKFVSLCRVPFPDSYYHKAIKGKFPCVKVVDPPEEPNGTGAKIQDTSGRDSDRSVEVSAGTACEQFRGTNSGTNVQDGVRMGRRDAQSAGRDAQSAGGRVVEIFGPQDGVTFVEEGHVYYLKGQRIPFSLTQILELSGLSRQPTEPSEIAARPAAAIRGTRVHEYTLWDDQGDLDLDDLKPWPEYQNRVLGWRQFREDFKFQPDLTVCEVPVAVRVNGMLYAMKLDAYGTIGEGESIALAVVEKKCTANEESSHALQTAGQAILFKAKAEELKLSLRRFVVYLFDKETSAGKFYRCVEHTDRQDEKIFVGAGLTNVYYRHNKGLLK